MNTGVGKDLHLDMLMDILQKAVLGNTTVLVGLLDMEEVRPLQAMEGDLHQDHRLHLEDMEDSHLGLRRRLEATDKGLHLEDMGEGQHHPFLEPMGQGPCQVKIMSTQDKKLR